MVEIYIKVRTEDGWVELANDYITGEGLIPVREESLIKVKELLRREAEASERRN